MGYERWGETESGWHVSGRTFEGGNEKEYEAEVKRLGPGLYAIDSSHPLSAETTESIETMARYMRREQRRGQRREARKARSCERLESLYSLTDPRAA